jgi:radical SAM superfamily enzyme YgiQ (UPF0313 family)
VISGAAQARPLDALFVNSPLKDYDLAPRYNDFTLPVLGLGYIATYAARAGLNVGVIDAEARGLGVTGVAATINAANPRWVGLNLLAPTYRHSTSILRLLDPTIRVMLGGHQAKAMPQEILRDSRIPRIDALILGEGETRVAAILEDSDAAARLPHVWWRTVSGLPIQASDPDLAGKWLSPDVDRLPFLDRSYLVQDPFVAEDGRVEANLVGSRGCPYDCSFCGAAKSANPDVSIRTREPGNLVEEMEELARDRRVSAFRFVDDLFLASVPFMKRCLPYFKAHAIGDRFVWDATGRINVLSQASTEMLDMLVDAGCREVALGIESGSERLLSYMGKRITPAMTVRAIRALTDRGINVKGYFILGFPTETSEELEATVAHIRELWEMTDTSGGRFRCSAFEFRPYPGTPEWNRLLGTGRYTAEQLLLYEQVDLTDNGSDRALLDRDEFNFSVNIQFGDASLDHVRSRLREILAEQKARLPELRDHVQRYRAS